VAGLQAAAAVAASSLAAFLPPRGVKRPAAVPCRAVPCRAVPCRAVPCRGAAALARVPEVGTAAGVHGIGARGGLSRQRRRRFGRICVDPVGLAQPFLR